jgi:hypothetical protein
VSVAIPESLAELAVTIDQVSPHPANARTHDDAMLRESLELHGQYRPLVVQRATGHVLAGNGTLAAATALGWDRVAVTYVDVDDERALRILAIDNRANDLAGYDMAALAGLLTGLPDLAGTGYTMDDLDDLAPGWDAPVVLPAQPTAAHYAETPEDEADRAERYSGWQPHTQREIREMVLVLTFPEYDRALALLTALRAARPADDLTAGHVALAALEHYAGHCGVAVP